MSRTEPTERCCEFCGTPLVRKQIARSNRNPELEPPSNFNRRQYCDMLCWRRKQQVRPPQPFCACGCGRLTRWRGQRWGKFATKRCFRKPEHPPWVDTDPAFWDWFAGFVDGEGCFGISLSHSGGRSYPQPFFKIALRADERAILDEIRDRLGCGRVSVHVPGDSNSNLQLKFELTSLADCMRLVEVLTAHPLRAKKRRDFETWSEAIEEKVANGNGPRIMEFREKLMAGRQYNSQLAKGGDAS